MVASVPPPPFPTRTLLPRLSLSESQCGRMRSSRSCAHCAMGLYHPSVSKYLLSSESRRDSTGKKLPPARVLGAAGTLVVQRAAELREKKKKNRIMAPPRMNEEFKRGEGVADASLGHSKEWTGSSGCKATPRGDLERAAGVAQGEAKEHRQDTKFSVFSFCDDRDSVGGLSLEFCCAQRDKKKKKKKKVLSQRQRVRPPPNNILRVLSSRTDSLGVGALFGSHGSQTQ